MRMYRELEAELLISPEVKKAKDCRSIKVSPKMRTDFLTHTAIKYTSHRNVAEIEREFIRSTS